MTVPAGTARPTCRHPACWGRSHPGRPGMPRRCEQVPSRVAGGGFPAGNRLARVHPRTTPDPPQPCGRTDGQPVHQAAVATGPYGPEGMAARPDRLSIVDAGMRQLWQTGWMHNRVRMIVGSFLVKDLLVPWQEGEAWFWDTLVDADAANSANWQWVAGCGADPSPFFRVFNPCSRVRSSTRTAPMSAASSPNWRSCRPIHPPSLGCARRRAAKASVYPGKTYPHPIVDHATARDRALDALRSCVRPPVQVAAKPTFSSSCHLTSVKWHDYQANQAFTKPSAAWHDARYDRP